MTWIVGTAPPFGYAVGVSDIRVTFPDGSEKDCLQKIYPVGRFIAAGFAGSVAIGFAMLQTLSRVLYTPDESQAWIPSAVAEWWQSYAQRVFSQFPRLETDLGCQLMIIGVHPNENNGDAPWARSEAYVFSAPNFAPRLAGPNEAISIGSGTSVEPYRKLLEKLSVDNFSLMKMEVMNPGGMGQALMFAIGRELQRVPTAGISSHLHICIVFRGKIHVGKNDYTTFPSRGRQEHFRMPNAARSYSEFLQIARMHRLADEGACC